MWAAGAPFLLLLIGPLAWALDGTRPELLWLPPALLGLGLSGLDARKSGLQGGQFALKAFHLALAAQQQHKQVELLRRQVQSAPGPGCLAAQQVDLDFGLAITELFTLVVYGQLILEQAELAGLDRDLVDQIFDFQIRDFSSYAVALHGKPSSTAAQQEWALSAIRKPIADAARFDRVWEQVASYDGAYEMRP